MDSDRPRQNDPRDQEKKDLWTLIEKVGELDLENASGEELQVLRRAFKALFSELLWTSTQTMREAIDGFLEQAQTAQLSLQKSSNCDPQRSHYFYLGQLNAVLEIASMIRHQAVPSSAATLLSRSQVAKDIVRVVLHSGSISPKDVAKALSRHSQNLVAVTKQLVQTGLLRRDEFGRSVRLSPTPLTRTAWLYLDGGCASSLIHGDEDQEQQRVAV